MKFTVTRLNVIEELIMCEVISYTRLNNALNELRYSAKIGNRPVL